MNAFASAPRAVLSCKRYLHSTRWYSTQHARPQSQLGCVINTSSRSVPHGSQGIVGYNGVWRPCHSFMYNFHVKFDPSHVARLRRPFPPAIHSPTFPNVKEQRPSNSLRSSQIHSVPIPGEVPRILLLSSRSARGAVGGQPPLSYHTEQ